MNGNKRTVGINVLSSKLATAGVAHVKVTAAAKKKTAAIDVDPYKMKKLLGDYFKESGNKLTTKINKSGSITLVTDEGIPRPFSHEIKTGKELLAYLKALIRTAKQVIK